MKYNINITIKEFEGFIEFIESKQPMLAMQKGVLGKSDSYKLNKLLQNSKVEESSDYDLGKYPNIELMLCIALSSKLYIRGNDKDGRLRLIKTPNMESFQSLNEYEKYVFLLQTYWTQYDFEGEFGRWIKISSFYDILAAISNSKEGERITKDEKYPSAKMYSDGADFFHHLRFFGFGELELIQGAKSKNKDLISSFYPNVFGIETSRILLSEALKYWNRNDLSVLLVETDRKIIPAKDEKCFDVLKNIFEGKYVINTMESKYVIEISGTYIFKVSLSKNIWRVISLSYKHTLGDLHIAIQEAFSFENDHLYAFCIGGTRRSAKPIYCKHAREDKRNTENTGIYSLELYIGQKILYLFDFANEWKFDVQLIQIDKDGTTPLNPIIIESEGKAPKQY